MSAYGVSGSSPTSIMPDMLSLESARYAAALVVSRCAYAISLGAPLYNRGAIAECLDVYVSTAQWCCIHAAQLPVANMIKEALHSSEACVSASRKAWHLRQAFDHAIAITTAIANASRSPSPVCTPTAPAAMMATGWGRSSREVPYPVRSGKLRPPDEPSAHAEGVQSAHPQLRYHKRHATSPSSSPAPSTEKLCYLITLPDDISAIIMSHCAGHALGVLAGTCCSLRARAHARATAVMHSREPSLLDPLGGGVPMIHPRWARTLHSLDLLEREIGPRPSSRQWWHEWPALCAADSAKTDQSPVDMRNFIRGGDKSIPAMLTQYAAGLSWMVDAGWTPLSASIAMLLLACGSAAIGHAVRSRSRELAASIHALCAALRHRAWAITTAAPPTFASIEGYFGLAASDPSWLALLEPGVPLGWTFRTCAPLQASIHPSRLPAVPEPTVEGPIHRVVSAACELRVGGPIVCFLSEVRAPGDALRTLMQTSPIGYALPPLAEITLVAVHQPGTWRHGDMTVWRQCFCVKARAFY